MEIWKITELWKDTEIVEALKHILQDKKYHFLEYNEKVSKDTTFLRVDVIKREAYRNISVVSDICYALTQTQGGNRSFSCGIFVSEDSKDKDRWKYFNIREKA